MCKRAKIFWYDVPTKLVFGDPEERLYDCIGYHDSIMIWSGSKLIAAFQVTEFPSLPHVWNSGVRAEAPAQTKCAPEPDYEELSLFDGMPTSTK